MKIGALLSATCILFVGHSIANANLLANGDLDQTYDQEIVPGFFLPKPTIWQNVGTRSTTGPYEDECSSEPWAGPAPTPVTTNGVNGDDWGVFFKAFTGTSTNLATGHLYQDVPGTPGLAYTLTGWAGAEANALLGDAVIAIEFLDAGNAVIGGNSLSILADLFVVNGQAFNYKLFTVSATAPAGTATVRARISMINAQSNPLGGGQAFVADDFDLTATGPQEFAPANFTVTAGLHLGGTVGSLAASDNNKVIILCDEVDAVGGLEVSATSPINPVSRIQFVVETSATRTDLTQFTRMWNYTTGSFETMDVRSTTIVDSSFVVDVTTNPSRFVNGADGAVKSTFTWIPQLDIESADGWTMSTDQSTWKVWN